MLNNVIEVNKCDLCKIINICGLAGAVIGRVKIVFLIHQATIMQRSHFYHIFLAYVFLSFEAPHLCSSAVVVSGKKQGFQQYPTSVNQCLQKCSAATDARKSKIKITEVSYSFRGR